MGNIVVDPARITRNLPDGCGRFQMICIYEVAAEVTFKTAFAPGNSTLEGCARSAARSTERSRAGIAQPSFQCGDLLLAAAG